MQLGVISEIFTDFGSCRADAVAVRLSRAVPETCSQRLFEITVKIERLRASSDRAAWVVRHSGPRTDLSSPWNLDEETIPASRRSTAGSEKT